MIFFFTSENTIGLLLITEKSVTILTMLADKPIVATLKLYLTITEYLLLQNASKRIAQFCQFKTGVIALIRMSRYSYRRQ